MKAKKIENGLALMGAVIVLIGVSFAADDALAEETADVTTTPETINNVTDHTLDGAKTANVETAAKAVASLAIENWVDLDIQLEDRTSTLIAGQK